MVMVPTLTPTLVSTTDMPDTPMPTTASTTARGPLMLSQRLMLMPSTATTVMVSGPTPTVTLVSTTDMPDTLMPTTARGPLMLSPPPSQRLMLMPTTATTVMLGPTPTVPDTVWDTEAT